MIDMTNIDTYTRKDRIVVTVSKETTLTSTTFDMTIANTEKFIRSLQFALRMAINSGKGDYPDV